MAHLFSSLLALIVSVIPLIAFIALFSQDSRRLDGLRETMEHCAKTREQARYWNSRAHVGFTVMVAAVILPAFVAHSELAMLSKRQWLALLYAVQFSGVMYLCFCWTAEKALLAKAYRLWMRTPFDKDEK